MRKLWIITLTALVFLFFSVTLLPAPTNHGCEEEKAQIAVLNSELATVYAELDARDLEIFELQVELENVHFDLTTAQFRLESTRLDLETTQLQLGMVEVELDVVKNDLKETRASLLIVRGELNDKNTENEVLQNKLALCLASDQPSVKGFWVGANTGIPFGVLGSASYQINNRFMATTAIGYMGGFQWQVGFSTRINR